MININIFFQDYVVVSQCSDSSSNYDSTIYESGYSTSSIYSETFSDIESHESLNKLSIFDLEEYEINSLYAELLCRFSQNQRNTSNSNPSMLVMHLQEIFGFSNKKHENIQQEMKCFEQTHTNLLVECIEGKELQSKDPKGQCNSFIILYLESDQLRRGETKLQLNTCNPVWAEETTIPVSINLENERLIIEVWECFTGNSLKRMINPNNIKSMAHQMRRKVVSGNGSNRLIGKSSVALKSVPDHGLVLWLNLEKKAKDKSQGMIKIRLDFCGSKPRDLAAREFRFLHKQMIEYDLEKSQIMPYWWNGRFSSYADDILREYTAQCPLTQVDVSLIEYSVYGIAHYQYLLSFSLFDGLLNKIMKLVTSGTLSSHEMILFWSATRNVLPSCFNFLRKMHNQTPLVNTDNVKKLREVLGILTKVKDISPIEDFDLFPTKVYS